MAMIIIFMKMIMTTEVMAKIISERVEKERQYRGDYERCGIPSEWAFVRYVHFVIPLPSFVTLKP